MRPGRLRRGEWLCGLSAVALLVVLALDWFDGRSGYGGLGKVLVPLLVLVALLGLASAVLAARGRPVSWPVTAAVSTSLLGVLLWPVLALRILVLGPDSRDVELWGYLGLVLAALVPLGAWLALADERKDAPESAYTPPPPRPLPGT